MHGNIGTHSVRRGYGRLLWPLSSLCVLSSFICVRLCDPMDCSPPGSSVPRILQARILEWIAVSFSRGSSRTRGQTCGSCICRQVLYHWATWEDQCFPRALDYPVSCIHEHAHTPPPAAEMTRTWSSQGGGRGERRHVLHDGSCQESDSLWGRA